MSNGSGTPPQISNLVDELEGSSAFHYGASAQSLGETTASVTTTDGETHQFDRVHVLPNDWVFGCRAVRSTEVPSVGVLQPRNIYPADSVVQIQVHPAEGSNESAYLTDLRDRDEPSPNHDHESDKEHSATNSPVSDPLPSNDNQPGTTDRTEQRTTGDAGGGRDGSVDNDGDH